MSDEDAYGPARPPQSSFIGPIIPDGLNLTTENNVKETEKEKSPEEAGDLIGPLPPSSSDVRTEEDLVAEFEERAKRMKDKLLNKDENKGLVREDWMLKLPQKSKPTLSLPVEKKAFNQSSSNYEDEEKARTLWTETPEEREKRMMSGGGFEEKNEVKRNKEKDVAMKMMIEEHNAVTNRNKSLLEMHKEKMEKKKKKKKRKRQSSSSSSSSSSPSPKKSKKKKKDKKHKKKEKSNATKTEARRPFDRDVDLNARSVMGSKARNEIINNSRQLFSRFSHGAKSSFL